jgi:DNA-directed RNA polymerase specialized sigma24 family protein
MVASWPLLHQSFSQQIRRPKSLHGFERLREREDPLRPFESPAAVVEFLTGPSTDLDVKDGVLRCLVDRVQRDDEGELASGLLWLGLSPGLDRIYWRRLRHFPGAEAELASTIAEVFVGLVRRIDLPRNARIAAALVRGTERGVIEQSRRHASDPSLLGDASSSELRAEPSLGELAGELLLWLRPLVGEDAELLTAVLVVGENQREAGERLGLSHEAARKRYRRALRTAQRAIAKRPSHFDLSRARLCLAKASPLTVTHSSRERLGTCARPDRRGRRITPNRGALT